jgi:hypothetical protein
MQNGQCSRWCSGEPIAGSSAENYASAIVPTTSLEIHRLPLAEQISIIFDGPAILDKAWETEGACALSKIAQHANQICSYFLPSIFTMPQITASADGC